MSKKERYEVKKVFTPVLVGYACRRYAERWTRHQIAEKLRIAESTVNDVLSRRTWKNVPDDIPPMFFVTKFSELILMYGSNVPHTLRRSCLQLGV